MECPNRVSHDFRVVDFQDCVKGVKQLRDEARFVFQCTACTEIVFIYTDDLGEFLKECVRGSGVPISVGVRAHA